MAAATAATDGAAGASLRPDGTPPGNALRKSRNAAAESVRSTQQRAIADQRAAIHASLLPYLGRLQRSADGARWAHVDSAGTAYLTGTHKGSTGRPVPLLMDFLLNRR